MRLGGRRGRSDEGAALVEFAILAPLIFALLLGMFTGGMALSQKNSMTNAVREGARLGATLPESASWGTDVRDRVRSLASGDLTDSQICAQLIRRADTDVVVQSWPSSCPEPETMPPRPSIAGIPSGECAVVVWARRTSNLEAVIYSTPLTLDADAIGRYERDC